MAPQNLQITADAMICKGDSIQLGVQNARVFQWTPSAGLSATSIANPKASPSATTTYAVNVTDNSKCVQNASVTITVNTLPVIGLSKSGDIDCSSGSAQLTASGGAQYQWSPAAGLSATTIANPVVSGITQNTLYTVTATSSKGCIASDSVMVLVTNSGSTNPYLMPSAFTPNKDGLNDCFGITKWGTINKLEFSVYNRWGQLIFFTKDPSKCWDGNLKGIQQQTGAFVYIIKASTSCTEIERHGTILLIR